MNDIFTYSQKNGSTIFTFPGRTKVLSTSPLNGGITTHLTHALNINCMNGDYECEMLGDTYEKDLMIHAQRLEINPQTATALSTAAWTELCAVETLRHQELSVTAAVSHLLLGSCYSEEIATGSGTDGTVIAACMDGKTTLTDASGHSKLGELIGRTVSTAVTQALLKQTAASGARQFQVLIRTARYGITPGIMWDFYKEHQSFFNTWNVCFEKASALEDVFLSRNRNSNLVLCVSLYLHLMDQLRWGLIMEPEGIREGKRLLLYGLYCGPDTFLASCYPAGVWDNEEIKGFSLRELLMYILLFYFSVQS